MKERWKACAAPQKLLARLLAAWCFVNVFLLVADDGFDEVSYAFSLSVGRYAAAWAGLFAAFSLLQLVARRVQTDAWLLTIGFTVGFTVGAGVLVLAAIGAFTCMRQAAYCTPNFDFGIFCNMFHNMRKTLLPLVTCERDKLLSHFAVHISPIYYLLLPFL